MSKVFIIAEAGVNHNGDISIARKMIDAAALAGADAIKFQTFRAEDCISRNAVKAEYQKKTTSTSESQLEMIKKLELSFDQQKELFQHCRSKGIMFLASAFDLDSIDFLNSLGVSIFKIPSGEITNLPSLEKIASFHKEIILSTGMADLEEVRIAVDLLLNAGSSRERISLLHCCTEYPAPVEEANLRAMETMRKEFGIKVGYSDHTEGIEVALAAAALGAEIIEKHFTLDKEMEGPDHSSSADVEELKKMVTGIRRIGLSLGDGVKKPSLSEKKNLPIVRKSIVARRYIRKGEVFDEHNLAVKRPGIGISPMRWHEVLGKISPRDFQQDEMIVL
ncbi:MAG: N-acetylneuraminate synthase [Candidatus Omnitrophica bacterium]|nr:N-acetylneuraminate synthase [Candidatus Omnitrophota bacterium]